MILALGWADCFALKGISAVSATQQALQEVSRAPLALPCMTSVLLELLLDRGEHGGIHERRHRNIQPILWWHVVIASRPARLQGLPPLSSETGSQRSSASFAERGHPHVSRIFQYVPDGGTVPDRPAHARSLLGGSQPADDLADRQPLLAHPLEYLPHNPCFLEHDLEPGVTTAFIFSNVAVAIRCSAQDAH